MIGRPKGDIGRLLEDWFVRIIVRRLFPNIPNDSSWVSGSSVEEVANEGDRGRLDPVNNPFRAETVVDFVGLALAEDRVDWDEGLQVSWSWVIERVEAIETPRERPISLVLFGVGELMPCARIDSMTSISPRGSVPPSVWAGSPSPARTDLSSV